MTAQTTTNTRQAPSDPIPMTPLRALSIWSKHLLALVIPLNALAFVATGPHEGVTALLFVLPLIACTMLDRRAGPARRAPSPDLPSWPFSILLWVLVAIQVANVVLLAQMMSQQEWLSLDTVLSVFVVGASSGYSGIVIAHELIHRPRWIMRQLGRLLLATVMYEHFYTEHVRGHHVRIGVMEDPATARFGETFNQFYFRTVPAQFRSAWRLETARLGDVEMRWYDPRILLSRVVHGLVVEIGMAAVVAAVFGPLALTLHLAQAVWASRALEIVNYFEHWGITRTGRRIEPQHSWDTDSWFTYYGMIGLSRHADHHAFASRSYEQLRLWEESPKLPRGYLAMFPLALMNNKLYQELMTAELRKRGLGPFADDQEPPQQQPQESPDSISPQQAALPQMS